ncbi:pantoate--beta-alanine ligase [Pseudomonas syringae]|nr:pantoate--beta-alanine ligase [Pseudomonas syringae]
MSERFCGQTRPHFFRAIATIVTKLLNIVQPDYSLFGEKDYQQLAVCRRLVETLNIPTKVIGVPTVRDNYGLALSSRNGYLSEPDRIKASALYRILQESRNKVLSGRMDYAVIEDEALKDLKISGFEPDYFSMTDGRTLQPLTGYTPEIAILCAAYIDNVRLIDNIVFTH